MTAIFSRSWEILRSEGLRSLWFKILGETIYRRMDVAEMRLSADSVCPVASQGLEIGLLQAADIDEFIAFRACNDRESVVERLAQGQLCVLVRKNGELIHSTWIAGGRVRIDYLDDEIQLSDNTAYVYEAYTCPAWRGQGVTSTRSPALNQYCLDRGYTRRLGVFWPENHAARRVGEKAGYSITGRIGYVGAGRFKKHFLHYQGEVSPFR